jgi:hypothetical protein
MNYDFTNENVDEKGYCMSNNVVELLDSLEQKLENQYGALDRLEEENRR